MGIDLSNYIEIFLQESNENLENMNESLLELEKNPDDHSLIEQLFRAAHTLKGMAATMGYSQMAELTHQMENVLEMFRSGTLQADSDLVTRLFKCLDLLSQMVEDISAGEEKAYDLTEIQQELARIGSVEPEAPAAPEPEPEPEVPEEKAGPAGTPEDAGTLTDPMDLDLNEYDMTVLGQARVRGYNAFHLLVELNEKCLLKSARAYLVVNQLEQKGEIIKTVPPVEKLEEEEFDLSFEIIYLTKGDAASVEAIVNRISEIERVLVTPMDLSVLEERFQPSGDAPEEEPAQVQAPASADTGESAPVTPAVSSAPSAAKPLKADKGDGDGDSPAKGEKNQLNQTIRVDLDRLNNIMNLVSELVIYRTRLEDMASQHKANDLLEPLEQVARITSSLQDLVLKIRMQPIDLVFKRFPRMVRDLSQELGKEINLIIQGENTELDRTVVSELGEPLVHLIRNAVGHGIESREERIRLGKDPAGTVHMMAYQEGNKAVIRITDEGKGIDPEKIRQVAERKGIDTADLSRDDLIRLIFANGFSTNDEVNSVSGRGVGMDVVKQKINQLGGTIELNSEVGQGTEFIIKLPLTLSIIQALLVNVGSETFAISLSFIEKVVSIRPEEIKMSSNQEVYIYTGKAIPVIRVGQRLNMKVEEEDTNLIIVKVGGSLYGLAVTSLYGQQEIVIKPFGEILKSARQYIGATILGDGMVTLILDVGNICGE